MICEIIQFSTAVRTTRAVSDKREGKPELPPPATETAKNARIRGGRKDAWEAACRLPEYWRARLDWCNALNIAQKRGIADSTSFPSDDETTRFELVETWREAVAKRLLTPAPDLGAVKWKRAKLAGGNFPYLPVKKERVERAIADDVAFLAAHPTRAKRGTS
jgi:hypothetical protein